MAAKEEIAIGSPQVQQGRDKESRTSDARTQARHTAVRFRKKVKSRKQAIAIGLSEARKAGKKVPKKKGTRKKRTKRKS